LDWLARFRDQRRQVDEGPSDPKSFALAVRRAKTLWPLVQGINPDLFPLTTLQEGTKFGVSRPAFQRHGHADMRRPVLGSSPSWGSALDCGRRRRVSSVSRNSLRNRAPDTRHPTPLFPTNSTTAPPFFPSHTLLLEVNLALEGEKKCTFAGRPKILWTS